MDASTTDAPSRGIEVIAGMIANREVPVAEISKRIALQIAGVLRIMTGGADRPFRRRSAPQRTLNDQVKAYRELQRNLVESDVLCKKDVLNLDGPKFRFVFRELIGLFQAALAEAGIGEQLRQNIMLQLGDLVKSNDERLRREVSKIESGS